MQGAKAFSCWAPGAGLHVAAAPAAAAAAVGNTGFEGSAICHKNGKTFQIKEKVTLKTMLDRAD